MAPLDPGGALGPNLSVIQERKKVNRLYTYVGPRELLELASSDVARCEPGDVIELRAWLAAQGLAPPVTLTFVVTGGGALRVAPRQAEHVACARGEAVRAAGELELAISGKLLEVLGVTNQSTGYCPEPSCFEEVRDALAKVGLTPPPTFAHAFDFRRCPACRTIAVVKDADFECAACGSSLPRDWNLDEPEP